jgi:predicted DNA-binding transcriptional regulator YafY
MSFNKLALIRYQTIDTCLCNRRRRWTLEDLIEKVSDALYEFEGITSGISRRTIQADLYLMRSDKLGYNAPIIVLEKKYYTYEQADFSISKMPMNTADTAKLREVVAVLKQFSVFDHFLEMQETIVKLENKLTGSTLNRPNIIQFEHNRQTKGLGHIPFLYQHISDRIAVQIEYKSFKSANARAEIYFPHLLKEFRNRWFLIAKPKDRNGISILALDRMISIQSAPKTFYEQILDIDFETYFDDVIGVSKMPNERPQKILLKFNAEMAPYVLTKPLHDSQILIREDEDKSILIQLNVVLNLELEREIMGFADNVIVQAPRQLIYRIRQKVKRMGESYE